MVKLLGLVHDDVRERAGQQVRVRSGNGVLVDDDRLGVRDAEHGHHLHVRVVGGDQVVDDLDHLLPFGSEGSVAPALAS